MSSEIILLDTMLAVYGPETKETRTEARRFVEDAVDRICKGGREGFNLSRRTMAKMFMHS